MKNYRRHAFTIIEVLIVIAIIAVLAGLLFPVFARSKDSAFKTAAMANAKQLGTAVLMYIDEADNKLPMSTNYAQSEKSPERLWTNVLQGLVKSEQVFIAPGSNGKFAKTWEDRSYATFGFNSSTAYDPAKGCTDGDSDQQGCVAFRKVASFDKQDDPSASAFFAVTPGGDLAKKYLGYEFSPYNGTGFNPDNPRTSPPLVSDRDLVPENAETLPAEFIKPIFARYLATGQDQGMTPVIFGDGHAKDYSAAQIAAAKTGIIWRLR